MKNKDKGLVLTGISIAGLLFMIFDFFTGYDYVLKDGGYIKDTGKVFNSLLKLTNELWNNGASRLFNRFGDSGSRILNYCLGGIIIIIFIILLIYSIKLIKKLDNNLKNELSNEAKKIIHFSNNKTGELKDAPIEFIKNKKEEEQRPVQIIEEQPSQTIAQQLKDFKELLDSEIITQEEFDAKKKELLSQDKNNNIYEEVKEIKKINKDNNKVLSTTIIVIFSMLALYFLFKAISTFSLLF